MKKWFKLLSIVSGEILVSGVVGPMSIIRAKAAGLVSSSRTQRQAGSRAE